MIGHLLAFSIPAAYTILPPAMDSRAATAMLLTIALQESRVEYRRQMHGGPARSFYQFELTGVRGVLSHPASRDVIANAMRLMKYSPDDIAAYVAIEHNDVLATCFARCLLWTLPQDLPTREQPEEAWQQYLAAWRPGKPHPDTFARFFARAWDLLEESPDVLT